MYHLAGVQILIVFCQVARRHGCRGGGAVGFQLAAEGLVNDQFLQRYVPALQVCQPAANKGVYFGEQFSSMFRVRGLRECLICHIATNLSILRTLAM
jgi:hypothetical protein